MPRPINRSVSYEIVTEESAIEGDAAERGWAQEREAVRLRELMDEMRERGIEHVEGTADGLRVSHDDQQDMRSGDYRTETTHITADARLARRLVRLGDKAWQRTYGRRLPTSSHLLADAYSTKPLRQAAAGWNRQAPVWDDVAATESSQRGADASSLQSALETVSASTQVAVMPPRTAAPPAIAVPRSTPAL